MGLREALDNRASFENYARVAAKATYAGKGVCLCRVAGKYPFYVQATDCGIASHLILDGYWESWVTVALMREVRAGMRIVDVGANHGYYSVLFADHVGPEGEVLAFEPNRHLCDLLRRNAEACGCYRTLKVYPYAAGGKSCDGVPLTYPPLLPGSGSIMHTPQRDPLTFDICAMKTLDEVLGKRKVDLIKIDAEGADYDVVEGAAGLIARDHPPIYLEHIGNFYKDPGGRIRGVQEMGYNWLAYVDYDGRLKSVTVEQVEADPERVWNLFFRSR